MGGSALSPFLYKKAKSLGWPILICYGMTESGSQIACSSLKSIKQKSFPKMKTSGPCPNQTDPKAFSDPIGKPFNGLF